MNHFAARRIGFDVRWLFVVLSCTLGCGGSVASKCSNQPTGTLQIAVPNDPAATLFINGDCHDFSCKKQSQAGCTLWQGTIDITASSSCSLRLLSATTHQLIDTATVDGDDACGTAPKVVTLSGDAPSSLR